jgi:hypothetical protein
MYGLRITSYYSYKLYGLMIMKSADLCVNVSGSLRQSPIPGRQIDHPENIEINLGILAV